MKFTFKHPKTGEIKEVNLTEKQIREEMEETARDLVTCDCEPIGETNVVECNCCEYYDDFELIPENKEVRGDEGVRSTD